MKGFYQYKVQVQWDFNQNTLEDAWVTLNNTFQLVVRAGPIDIIRHWSSDLTSQGSGMFYSRNVDYPQSFMIAPYDAWNNTVEPDLEFQTPRNGLQGQIARRMAVKIIHRLEPIQIDEDAGKRSFFLQCFRERVQKATAI